MISVAKHIVTIYEDEKNQSEGYYTVWDKKGKEITDQFKRDVQEYAKKRDYENIITYFVNDISIIEKTTEVWHESRSGDLAKTWVKEIIRDGVFHPTNPDPNIPMPVTVIFECELSGTIYYDPNTMRITTTSGPFQLGAVRRTDLSGTSTAVEYRYWTPSTRVTVASDRLSANFYFSMHITGYLAGYDKEYDFGYLGGSDPVYTATVA